MSLAKKFWPLFLVFLLSFGGVFLVKEWGNLRKMTGFFNRSIPQEPIFRPEKYSLGNEALLDEKETRLLQRLEQEQINLVRKVVKSVVCITTGGEERQRFTYRGQIYEGQSPVTGIGSGVIISKEGHVITNDHVVAGQSVVQITTHNGEELKAVVIGTDPSLDIAVLKIEDNQAFDPLLFGDSDQVEVGQSVYAVGNPFGLGETVTKGIISAKERSFSDQQRDLFQTDAAINPGNSGGPLVNVKGEVIGINVAILATDADNPGSSGVGFSIPSNDVLSTFKQIAEKGRPVRGYLGVDLREFQEKRSEGRSSAGGQRVLVYRVENNSPAQQVGLQRFDELISFNAKRITSRTEVIRLIQQSPINEKVTIEYLRGGMLLKCSPTIAESPNRNLAQHYDRTQRRYEEVGERLESFGLRVRDLTLIESIRGLSGVLVTSVKPASVAKRAGLKAGDLVVSINGQSLYRAEQFYSAIVAAKAKDRLNVVVQREEKRVRVLFNVN